VVRAIGFVGSWRYQSFHAAVRDMSLTSRRCSKLHACCTLPCYDCLLRQRISPLAGPLVSLFFLDADTCFVPTLRDATTGTEKIEQRQARYENAKDEKDKESNDDPQFIKDLLAVHDKYLGVVSVH
jgi:hypothetical protein